MTEGYQPPTSRKNNPDQDTATLPRVNVPPAGPAGTTSGGSTGGSSAPSSSVPNASRSGAAAGSSTGPSHGGSSGWSQPSRNSAATPPATSYQPGSVAGFGATPATDEAEAPSGGIGARLSAAASTVATTATSAASNAKNSIKSAANEAETRAGRPSGRQARNARQPRRARLTLSHVNVYSVFKLSCVLAIALFFVWLIMIGVLYGILDVSGVFDRINQAVHQISGDGKTNNVVTGSLVGGFAIIIGVVYIVLFIALSTIGAMVYNLCADLVGGVEVTLSERE